MNYYDAVYLKNLERKGRNPFDRNLNSLVSLVEDVEYILNMKYFYNAKVPIPEHNIDAVDKLTDEEKNNRVLMCRAVITGRIAEKEKEIFMLKQQFSRLEEVDLS